MGNIFSSTPKTQNEQPMTEDNSSYSRILRSLRLKSDPSTINVDQNTCNTGASTSKRPPLPDDSLVTNLQPDQDPNGKVSVRESMPKIAVTGPLEKNADETATLNVALKLNDIINSMGAANQHTEEVGTNSGIISPVSRAYKTEANSNMITGLVPTSKNITEDHEDVKTSETILNLAAQQKSVLATLVDHDDEIPPTIKNENMINNIENASFSGKYREKQEIDESELKRETEKGSANVKLALIGSLQSKQISPEINASMKEGKKEEKSQKNDIEESSGQKLSELGTIDAVMINDTNTAKSLMDEIMEKQKITEPITTSVKVRSPLSDKNIRAI